MDAARFLLFFVPPTICCPMVRRLTRQLPLLIAAGVLLLNGPQSKAQQLPHTITISPTKPILTPGQQFQMTAIGNQSLPIQGVRQISAGEFNSCALLTNGTVQCWGDNVGGQLGNGTNAYSGTPGQTNIVNGLTGVIQIAVSSDDACALLSSGAVECWGGNNDGALGSGSATDGQSTVPVPVSGITNATSIAGSMYVGSFCVLLVDGTVSCWGGYGYDTAGSVVSANSFAPIPVSNLSSVHQITVGADHACALLTDGTARCWGDNQYGSLGDGTTVSSTVPVTVSNLSGIIALSAGDEFTCALLSDQSVQCWGALPTTDSLTPVTITGFTSGIANLSSGGQNTCVTLVDGTVECWGGVIDTATPGTLIPAPISGWSQVLSLSNTVENTCALLADGTASCWGDNLYSQLGPQGGYSDFSPTPVVAYSSLLPGGGVSSIAAGGQHSCVILSYGGTARCWGNNVDGQLGNGSTTNVSTSVPVTGLSAASAIAGGEDHSCALVAGGTAQCWGSNASGQLGNGTTTNSSTPVSVSGLTEAIAITTGSDHNCALFAGGTAKCWGSNTSGQLGNGSTTNASTPTSVSSLTGAVVIVAGESHTCALLPDGSAKCWGSNANGQVGNGSTTNSSTPVSVSSLTGAVSLAAGGSHTCALFSDGSVQCWGANSNGQLGNGSTTDSSTPVTVGSLNDAKAIAVGADFTCAIVSDGTARCWGANTNGQLGNGATTGSTVPVTVAGLTDASSITAGDDHACAILADGTVRCWGANADGQLGNSSTTNSSSPVPATTLASAPSWTSSDSSVATVQPTSGAITTASEGSATITAAFGSTLHASTSVSVIAPYAIQVSPTSVTFASAVPAPRSPYLTVPGSSFTVTNSGNATVSLGAVYITGPAAADFTASSGLNYPGNVCGALLAPQTSCTTNLSFFPSQIGLRSATLHLPDSASNSPQAVQLSGIGLAPVYATPASIYFGPVAVGNTSRDWLVTLNNTTNQAVSIQSIAFSGPGAQDFSYTTTSCISVVAPGVCYLHLSFTPHAVGDISATLSINDNATGSPQTVALSGSGSLPLSFSPASLNFGLVGTGTSGVQTVIVRNIANAPVTFFGSTISPASSAFTKTEDTCTGSSIPQASYCTIGITFTPTGLTSDTAALTLTDNASNSPQTISLTGTGVDQIRLSSSYLAFGTQAIGVTGAAQTLTLANDSNDPVSINSFGITGANASDFSVLSSTCGAFLGAYSRCTVSVIFSPSSSAPFSATLLISDGAVNSPQAVSLTGRGR
jgi:alpha-tubulin suppressor-like RCC1 family protein